MDIKETKIQIGLDKDGGRNCFKNIAVKRMGGKYLNGWTVRETDCENANWRQQQSRKMKSIFFYFETIYLHQ